MFRSPQFHSVKHHLPYGGPTFFEWSLYSCLQELLWSCQSLATKWNFESTLETKTHGLLLSYLENWHATSILYFVDDRVHVGVEHSVLISAQVHVHLVAEFFGIVGDDEPTSLLEVSDLQSNQLHVLDRYILQVWCNLVCARHEANCSGSSIIPTKIPEPHLLAQKIHERNEKYIHSAPNFVILC